MSMTKRYLESLPIEEQNAILGGPEDDEPLEECAICGCGFSSMFEGIVCPDCTLVEGDEEC